MAKIRIIFENGDPERTLEFDPRAAPFQHDGVPGSILDILLGHHIHLEHACGGNCACTTCHVIVKQGFEKLGEASEQEEDLLDRAPGLTPTSRLGCQAVIEDPNAEIVIVVPRFTIKREPRRMRAAREIPRMAGVAIAVVLLRERGAMVVASSRGRRGG